MLQKVKPRSFLLIFLICSMSLFAGCTKTETSADSAGVGFVTESTTTDTIESSGSVEADQLATLTWGTSGTVDSVTVNTGEIVSSGTVMAGLDTSTAPAEIVLAVTKLLTAQQNLEIAKTSQVDLAEAQVALVDAQSAYNEARTNYLNRNSRRASDDYLAILKNNLLSANNSVSRLEFEYNKYAESADTDSRKASALANLAQARLNAKDALNIYNYYSNNYSEQEVAEIEAAYALAKAELDDAQKLYDAILNGDNTDAVTAAQAEVDAAQANVNKLSIIAPFNGEVAAIYSQSGDVVSEGDKAIILVNRDKLYVDVSIDETSIHQVAVGNPAIITFDALDSYSTTGKVTLINPVGTASSGVVNYTVRVELDSSDPTILIGATATVVITTGEPKNTLFVPVTAVLTDAQGEYVMRVNQDGTQERVSVISGNIYDETVVVVGDLKVGDQVQLFDSLSSNDEDTQVNDKSLFGTMGGGEMPSREQMPFGGGAPGGGAPSMP